MNHDLISREALKEHKFLTPQVKIIGSRHCGKTREQIVEAYQKGWNDCIDAIIDNAPAVEPVKQCKYCKHCGNEDYCSNCHSDHSLFEYYERPQGEWLYPYANVKIGGRRVGKSDKECSVCHSGFSNNLPWNAKFCPNCGADMRKGGKE